MKSKLMLSALLITGAAVTGCGRTNDLYLTPLDQPAIIQATGAQTASQVTMYRMGTWDPNGTLTTMRVTDTSILVSTTADKATVEELVFKLEDVNLPPTSGLPQGVNLRNQELRITQKVPAPMEERDMNAVTVKAHTSLQYRAAMILDDGTLYQLGNTNTEPVDLDVRATRYFGGIHVTVDGAPQGKCWSIPGVIDITNCSLYVETEGNATSND
jgi:predicted small lipoprotein YifL